YLGVMANAPDGNAFAKLGVTLHFANLNYSLADDREAFTLSYEVGELKALPIAFLPYHARMSDLCDRLLAKHQPLVILYEDHAVDRLTQEQAFRYRLAYGLLVYLALLLVIGPPENPNLFLPLLRMHPHNREKSGDQGTYLRALSKVLAHLLGEGRRSGSQGFNLENELRGGAMKPWVARNGLASLYAGVPKRFTFQRSTQPFTLEKLAIVVVSSWQSDRLRGREEKLATLMGEIILVERLGPTEARVAQIGTFTTNDRHDRLTQNPTFLFDQVDRLYDQGVRHLLYVAHAPYTSTLHLTERPEEKLFFLSPAVIEGMLRTKPDLVVYPLFFDSYAAAKLNNYKQAADSMYIYDPRELARVAQDPNQQSVVVFNLFNGRDWAVKGEGFYNRVVSYSTLLNMYADVQEDNAIREGLLKDGALKHDILTYLTLFHFSRYEAAPTRKRSIAIKLDPYAGLIGNDALGKQATFPHMTGNTEWSLLAFLTAVGSQVEGMWLRKQL
ncbi:MAG: hypothetical protein H0T73_15800, partial [Ardenticatenales bacterium]|nr:hypothetical protein [Ardenticatenales bacterium]